MTSRYFLKKRIEFLEKQVEELSIIRTSMLLDIESLKIQNLKRETRLKVDAEKDPGLKLDTGIKKDDVSTGWNWVQQDFEELIGPSSKSAPVKPKGLSRKRKVRAGQVNANK